MNTLPFPSEKFIEDYLWSVLKEEDRCVITDQQVSFSYRQLELIGYGITDIVQILVFPFEVEVRIVELKNETLKEAHLSQLARYMAGMNRFLRRYKKIACRYGWDVSVKGILAGPFTCSGDFVYLLDQLPDIEAYDVAVSLEKGFYSSEVGEGWHSKKENPSCINDIARGVFGEATHLEREIKALNSSNVTAIDRGLR